MIITKDLVQAHITCPRIAHAKIHKTHESKLAGPDLVDRMVEGGRVGRAARELFANGNLIPTTDPWDERVSTTQQGTVNLLRPKRLMGRRGPKALSLPWPHPIL